MSDLFQCIDDMDADVRPDCLFENGEAQCGTFHYLYFLRGS
jgi:hypothetical protein